MPRPSTPESDLEYFLVGQIYQNAGYKRAFVIAPSGTVVNYEGSHHQPSENPNAPRYNINNGGMWVDRDCSIIVDGTLDLRNSGWISIPNDADALEVRGPILRNNEGHTNDGHGNGVQQRD